jgi:methanogenic corrinoid protein MtbC1
MRNDPEVREREAGSIIRGGDSGVGHDGRDIHNVIERAVVGACFKSAARTRDAESNSQPCESAFEHPPQHQYNADPYSRARAPARSREKVASTAAAGCGTAAMARMKRFMAVTDKVYGKVLDDGDFDFIGFMAARGLDAGEMLDLLEACAVRLGEDWASDACSFVHVTLAMSRLQRILTTLGQENSSFDSGLCDRSALFIVPRGEIHLFAVSLMEERFRLNGWECRMVPACDPRQLSRLLRQGVFELVCLTWLDSELENQVESLLRTMRASVDREQTFVIAGGSAAELRSAWLIERGVEKVCSNAHIAVAEAERYGANRNSAHKVTDRNGSLLEPMRRA